MSIIIKADITDLADGFVINIYEGNKGEVKIVNTIFLDRLNINLTLKGNGKCRP